MSEQKANSDTRERILDVAERLFMETGYEATSMRAITGVAEVNLAAVNYHFGSKEALLREVFRRRLTWLNHARLQALDRLEQQSGDAPLKPSQILLFQTRPFSCVPSLDSRDSCSKFRVPIL